MIHTLPLGLNPVEVVEDRGEQILDLLMLNQYNNSPLLKAYIMAFVGEMDTLFKATEEVYLGRMLEWAVGNQLDVIGIHLDEDRRVNLPTRYFGFSDGDTAIPTPLVDPMANEASPEEGGIFRGEEQEGTSEFSLGDTKYRRLLVAKAALTNAKDCSINTVYYLVSILLGRVPSGMSISVVGDRAVEMKVDAEDVTSSDAALVSYFSKYFVPLGTTFVLTRIT